MYSHQECIDWLIKGQAGITACYLISALIIGGNSYAGFNAVFLGLVFSGGIGATYYGLKMHVSRTHFGMLLGGAIILMFISLESSIFWGQYGDCSTPSNPNSRRLNPLGPECTHTATMKAVCTFSVFMFLSYIVMIALLVHFKDEILGSAPLQEGYNVVGQPGTAGGANQPPQNPYPVSVDI
eukprot:CAMPEP_0181288518 /NCGR_PEP_ID=MMETSP1101-20121128/377_1 /TAXON_ID=46948 /ORGANISM="Rhodomonas abbreviata, Strain Caron Lab Isolate" /LENGTH=181 /DNA_ID=CAMNT_0023392649 /DNA_START=105 /DNA_END=650 /DNA_ORIENTATION=+